MPRARGDLEPMKVGLTITRFRGESGPSLPTPFGVSVSHGEDSCLEEERA